MKEGRPPKHRKKNPKQKDPEPKSKKARKSDSVDPVYSSSSTGLYLPMPTAEHGSILFNFGAILSAATAYSAYSATLTHALSDMPPWLFAASIPTDASTSAPTPPHIFHTHSSTCSHI
ncbi:hypothetical protein VNI00_006053 [Paramarasmius palmivorus]|uniref:Uncharacterized protein n=1 Tax=Paramarasmius palmivorus TaxID=297713 RepID=A0AAW0DEE1_9AGAR